MTNGINLGLLVLAFARPLQILLGQSQHKAADIMHESTGGLTHPQGFTPEWVARFYGPMAAALILHKVKGMLLRRIRVKL